MRELRCQPEHRSRLLPAISTTPKPACRCIEILKEWSGDADKAREAEDNDYFAAPIDGAVQLNCDEPSVSETLKTLGKVQKFLDTGSIDNELSAEFFEQYVKRFNHRAVFSSKKVWEEHLGL